MKAPIELNLQSSIEFSQMFSKCTNALFVGFHFLLYKKIIKKNIKIVLDLFGRLKTQPCCRLS